LERRIGSFQGPIATIPAGESVYYLLLLGWVRRSAPPLVLPISSWLRESGGGKMEDSLLPLYQHYPHKAIFSIATMRLSKTFSSYCLQSQLPEATLYPKQGKTKQIKQHQSMT